jgi:hypothetical protein
MDGNYARRTKLDEQGLNMMCYSILLDQFASICGFTALCLIKADQARRHRPMQAPK